MPSDVELIKSRVDLVELVQERVRLTRSSKGWKGRCPFHEDSSPSFFVYNDGHYYCFGCGQKGDLFEWVKRTENLDFADALKALALRAGVTLSGNRTQSSSDTNALRDILEQSLKFFRAELDKSEIAKSYLTRRGVDSDTISKWEIGYAPDFDESLIRFLKSQGVSLTQAAEAGVVSGEERQGFRDFFRARIIFPIRDESSRLAAFGGRLLGAGEPKYLNSREAPGLFDKGQTLYGLNRARGPIQEKKTIVLCEGYLDVIACHRAGITNAVAPLGTGFTTQHGRKAKRYAEKLITLFDGDKPGRTAAKRAAELCAGIELDARIAVLPEGDDPDTMFSRGDAARLRERVESPTTPLRFEIRELAGEFGDVAIIEDVVFWRTATKMLAMADPVEADMLVIELSSKHPSARFDASAAMTAIRKQVEAARPKPKQSKAAVGGAATKRVAELPLGAERPILRAAFSEAFRVTAWHLLMEVGLIVSPPGRKLADSLLETFAEPPQGPGEPMVAALDEDAAEIARLLEKPIESIHDRAHEDVTLAAIEGSAEKLREERRHREKMSEFGATGDLAALSEFLRQD
ncbi:MAG: DNA primase [Fimbriimonadales bacterium]